MAEQNYYTEDTLRQYLNRIKHYPNLSAQEEVSLGRSVQKGLQTTQLANELLGESDTSIPDEVLMEMQSVVEEGRRAHETMYLANLRSVVSLAQKTRRDLDILDKIQEGNIALSGAIDDYNPALGFRFSTFSHSRIKPAIYRTKAAKTA